MSNEAFYIIFYSGIYKYMQNKLIYDQNKISWSCLFPIGIVDVHIGLTHKFNYEEGNCCSLNTSIIVVGV